MKKILLTLLLSLVTLSAFTQTELRQGNLIFTLYQPDDGVPYAEVTGNSLSQKTDLIIPSKVSYDGIDYTVTSIGYMAFSGCRFLGSVDIPASVTTIGYYTFYSGNIREIIYNTTEPIEALKYVFPDEVYANATLNVAVGGLENAKRTSPWMYFNDIREIEFSGVDSPVAEFCSDGPVAIYDINGIYVGDSERSLAPGMYVVRQGDKARLVYVK